MGKILSFLGHFLAYETIEKGVKSLLNLGAEHAKETLKSSFMGLGVNDELLFMTACVYAKDKLGVSDAKILEVCNLIDALELRYRNKVVRMIGQGEQEVSIKEPMLDPTGKPVTDKKGNPVFKESKSTANVRGASIIKMLADLPDNAARLSALKASGAMTTGVDHLKQTFKDIANEPAVQQAVAYVGAKASEIKTNYEAELLKPTMLEKIGKKLDIFGLTK